MRPLRTTAYGAEQRKSRRRQQSPPLTRTLRKPKNFRQRDNQRTSPQDLNYRRHGAGALRARLGAENPAAAETPPPGSFRRGCSPHRVIHPGAPYIRAETTAGIYFGLDTERFPTGGGGLEDEDWPAGSRMNADEREDVGPEAENSGRGISGSRPRRVIRAPKPRIRPRREDVGPDG